MAKNEQPAEKKVQRFYEPICSPIVDVFEWREDEQGHHYLAKVGTKNVDDEIQLYKDACDIKVIIDRMMKGDIDTIHQLASPGLYGDVNDYPQEVHPAAYAQGLMQLYENQPDSVKEKFQSYEAFAKFYANLTEAMIAEMFKEPTPEAPKEGE